MIKAATIALLLAQSGQYPTMVGNWYVTREINEDGEQYCAALAEYRGPDLAFVLFDERYRRELNAQVLNPTTIMVELGFNGDIATYDEYDAISRGYALGISSARSSFSFDLVGTSAAFSELRDCMSQTAQNPFASGESQNPFSGTDNIQSYSPSTGEFSSLREQLLVAQNQMQFVNAFYGEDFSVQIDGDFLALSSDQLVGIIDVFPATLRTVDDFLAYDASNLALLNSQCERYASVDGTRFAAGLTSLRQIYCNDLEMLSLFWCDEVEGACFSANLVVVEDENSFSAPPSVSAVVEEWSERIDAQRGPGER